MLTEKLRVVKLATLGAIIVLITFWSFSEKGIYAHTSPQNNLKKNPVSPTLKNTALGMDHFNAHCAECHGQDGKANIEKGRSISAADLSGKTVQSMTDAEMFDAISNGVKGTAMPAFSKSHSATEIWQTILYLRRLPTLTSDERKKLEAAIPPEARHHHHDEEGMGNEKMEGQKGEKQDSTKKPDEHAGHDMSKMGDEGMTSMNSLMVMMGDEMGIRLGSKSTNAIPMGQMGSGTSWLPRSSPMYMYHKETNGWLLMFHFDVKAGANAQGGPRGVAKFESSNWFMPMAFHKLGPGTIQFRGMFSFEPFTFAPGGTPLLFQTGETFNGQPLIDRQHPHDLFMELSTTYTVPIGERASWFAYVGYPGEPALGPVAFMHRASAMETPAAPLAHHLQDSTHISFGVFTSGVTYRGFKVEGSIFNGREPDENRYNFEAGKWDSRSIRLSYAPNQNWSLQWSYGLLRKPEALESTDQRRMTASISYNKPFNRGNWASSLIWGRNHNFNAGPAVNLNGYTAESTISFLDRNYVFTRLELVDKNELLRAQDLPVLGITDQHKPFRIGAYTFGGARDIVNSAKLSFAIGSDITFYSMPSLLNRIYGKNPVSFQVFFRLRPQKTK